MTQEDTSWMGDHETLFSSSATCFISCLLFLCLHRMTIVTGVSIESSACLTGDSEVRLKSTDGRVKREKCKRRVRDWWIVLDRDLGGREELQSRTRWREQGEREAAGRAKARAQEWPNWCRTIKQDESERNLSRWSQEQHEETKRGWEEREKKARTDESMARLMFKWHLNRCLTLASGE